MKKVVVNVEFIDRYSKKKVKAGSKLKLTEERIAEINSVNPHFITVIGNVDESDNGKGSSETETTDEKKGSAETGKPE